ncbi:MAG: phosphodiester glycosidase family protein [Bacteroidales bacterium]|nr:phosphodiester glycosidase family protein [Bacteroidales bacterium]
MKKIFRTSVAAAGLLMCASSVAFAAEEAVNHQINIGDKEYTATLLQKRDIGPGTTWRRIRIQEYPLNVNLVTMDMSNPYNRVETFQGQDKLGSTESIVGAAQRLSSENHVAVAAANGNFWCVSNQAPWSDLLIGTTYGGNLRNGKIITETNNASDMWCGTPLQICLIGADPERLWIEPLVWRGYVSNPSIGYLDFQQVNKVVRDGEIGLYNSYYPAGKSFQPVNMNGNHFEIVDKVSTEVLLKLAEGEEWTTGADMKTVVTEVRKDAGRGTLGSNDLALVGRGANREALAKLAVGDTVTLNSSWTSFQTWETPRLENALQALALVLKDGEIDPQTNQQNSYNNQVYPKTIYGCSKDNKTLYIMTIDKSIDPVWGSSAGCPSWVACEILKDYGCWRAAAVDAGGSTEMFVTDRIVNRTTEGNPRAVANGWMVFATSPTDNEIARLEFDEVELTVPVLSQPTPKVLGYNKYGMLINEDVQGISFTCTPEAGECIDGHFYAASTPGTGQLTASFGGVSVSKPITVTDAEVAIRLKDIIIDHVRQYPIEVQALVDGNQFDYKPSTLTWTSSDPSVADVDSEGVLKGLKNGVTVLHGQIGQFTDSTTVHVEIPESPVMVLESIDPWKTSMTSIKNPQVTLGDNNNINLSYQISSSRAPKLTIQRDSRMFGLPDGITMKVNPGTNVSIKSIVLSVQGANQSRAVTMTVTPELEPSKDNEIYFDFHKLDETTDLTQDLAFYPVTFKSLAFNFGNATGNYSFDITTPAASYNNHASGVEDITVENGQIDGKAMYFNLDGVRVAETNLAPGIYIVRQGSKVSKILVK